MKYQANPIVVEAFSISAISPVAKDGSATLTLANGETVTASGELVARTGPTVGDYWVIAKDDEADVLSRAEFQRKYTPVPETVKGQGA